MFSVEEVNRLVLEEKMPFRDAYKKVGLDIEAGNFTPNKDIHHTHEGSIGNLCTAEVRKHMDEIVESFGFDKTFGAVEKLVRGK